MYLQIQLQVKQATGVWVGGEDRSVHFARIDKGQGASMALPIWALYYKKLYADKNLNISQEDFLKPEKSTIQVDCDKNIDKDNPDGKNFDENPEF